MYEYIYIPPKMNKSEAILAPYDHDKNIKLYADTVAVLL